MVKQNSILVFPYLISKMHVAVCLILGEEKKNCFFTVLYHLLTFFVGVKKRKVVIGFV